MKEKKIYDINNKKNTLHNAYTEITNANLDTAIEILEKSLTNNIDDPEILSALKISNFWIERFTNVDTIENQFEQGEYLLNQWKNFETFLERTKAGENFDVSIVKVLIYKKAYTFFRGFQKETKINEPELLMRIGRTLKGSGEYDKAFHYLDNAAKTKKDDAEIVAELADCYALLNETQKSKAFFREAFYINPQKVELSFLESEMIKRLVTKVREFGYNLPVLKEWIPVYGVLLHIFSIKRELRSIEYGKLRQTISFLETELTSKSGTTSIDMSPKEDRKEYIIPRLLNRYFWLMDYYTLTKSEREKKQEVLKKIQHISPDIYEKYTNGF